MLYDLLMFSVVAVISPVQNALNVKGSSTGATSSAHLVGVSSPALHEAK